MLSGLANINGGRKSGAGDTTNSHHSTLCYVAIDFSLQIHILIFCRNGKMFRRRAQRPCPLDVLHAARKAECETHTRGSCSW